MLDHLNWVVVLNVAIIVFQALISISQYLLHQKMEMLRILVQNGPNN